MEKQKIEIYPIRSLNTIWDKIAVFALAVGFGIGILAIIFFDSKIIFVLCVVGSFLGFILLKNRNALPEVRWFYIWFFIPIAFGFSLSVYSAGDLTPLLFGASIAGFIALWFGFLRHPSSFRAASKAFQAGDQLQALQYINQTLNQYPTHWESYQLRSTIQLMLYKIIEAERDARKAIKLKPKHYLCHNALGMALLPQERYTEAKDALSRALELAPQYAINYFNMGLVAYRLGEFQEAIKYLHVALTNEIPPDSYLLGYYYLGQSFLQVGDIKNANIALETLKKHKVSYEKLVARYKDRPDYPSIVLIRHELEDIKSHLA